MSSFLPDEPINNATKFGFDVYSKALAKMMKSQELETPFTIAIHGDWGSGKTSLMMTVANELENTGENEVKTKAIWFNAWEFEKLPIPLWKVFLNRIIMELQDLVKEDDLKQKIKKTGESLLILTSEILLKKGIGLSLDKIEDIKSQVWKDIKKIDSLKENFSSCIETALKEDASHTVRLAIFVDDLDRCLPEHCIEVFESIKLFLNSKRCVFIIGINKDQICKAFEIVFREKSSLGLNYMEKFVQLQFDLPRKNPLEIQSFLSEFASNKLKDSPKTIELISRFIEPNPRKVKRWLNSVIFLEELFQIRRQNQVFATPIDVSLVSIWLFLKSFFVDFASMIENDPTILNSSIRISKQKGSEEDQRKMKDYAIDERLIEFLSTLKSEYDENQLNEVVYLSKLTPVEQVSVLPSTMIDRILEMSADELSAQLERLTNNGLSALIDRITDELVTISNYEEYQKNLDKYDLLNRLFNKTKKGSKKILVFEKIFAFMENETYGSQYFLDKISTYVLWDDIKKIVSKKEYLDKFVSMLVKSSSFITATNTSAILSRFSAKLTKDQIRTIIEACITNDQIQYSFGARKNLEKILVFNGDIISPEEKKKIKNVMQIEIPEY